MHPQFLGHKFFSWGYGKPSVGTSLGQAQTHKHHTCGARQHSEEPSHGGWKGWQGSGGLHPRGIRTLSALSIPCAPEEEAHPLSPPRAQAPGALMLAAHLQPTLQGAGGKSEKEPGALCQDL